MAMGSGWFLPDADANTGGYLVRKYRSNAGITKPEPAAGAIPRVAICPDLIQSPALGAGQTRCQLGQYVVTADPYLSAGHTSSRHLGRPSSNKGGDVSEMDALK